MDPKQRVREFLARYSQLPEDVNLDAAVEGMLQEMKLHKADLTICG